MTVVRPFRALRYDPARVDLGRVVVPPYDVITAEERETLYARDPHCAVRLELTRDVADESSTDYTEVAETLAAWRRSGVLTGDAARAFYAMRQRFRAPDGRELVRDGFFAALRLESYDARVVRPHERTMAGPKADRLRMLRATRANLSSVFLLYEDPEEALAATLADAFDSEDTARARDASGVELSLAPLREPEAIDVIERFLGERPVVIADGHHRYETALTYRDEQNASGDAPAAWTLGFFANAYAPGTLLLPIHRVIRKAKLPTEAAWRERMPGWSQAAYPLRGPEHVAQALAEHLEPLAGRPAFAADDASGILRVFSRPEPLGERLMVKVAEDEILAGVFGLTADDIRDGAVSFPKSAERAATEVRAGEGTVAIYLNPLAPEDVFRVTAAGGRMPQKSTFFAPKIPTGLVFRLHEESA
ncbi:MAG: DUF1015 domain-containing protein [Proteobacteria bacterium]|nr:DUF1015 domain-containing protein [Pseudomonadota bacterium]